MTHETASPFASTRRLPLLAMLLVAPLGCADVGESTEDAADGTLELASERALAEDPALCCGARRTLVEGIPAAENLLMSSDERLFVTGDEGIYEIVRGDDGGYAAETLAAATDCQFGGITETREVLYVNCYNFGDSYLYAAELTEKPSFRRIVTLDGILLANGLSSDPDGNVYVATTGQNQILRLRFAAEDPFELIENRPFVRGSGLLTNGLKFYQGALYWSDGGYVKRAIVGESGELGRTRTLLTRLTFLDDLYVSTQGILVTDYLGNAVRAFDLNGRARGVSRIPLTNPSSVLRAEGRAGFAEHALIVTERGANRLSVVE